MTASPETFDALVAEGTILDWWHSYSDDGEVRARGGAQCLRFETKLANIAAHGPGSARFASSVWDTTAPREFGKPQWHHDNSPEEQEKRKAERLRQTNIALEKLRLYETAAETSRIELEQRLREIDRDREERAAARDLEDEAFDQDMRLKNRQSLVRIMGALCLFPWPRPVLLWMARRRWPQIRI